LATRHFFVREADTAQRAQHCGLGQRLASHLLLPRLGQGLQRPVRARGGQLLEGVLPLLLDQGLLAGAFARLQAVAVALFARQALDAGQ
jgi:hypothetical protein